MYELCREYSIELIEQYEKGINLIELDKEKIIRYRGFIPSLGITSLLRMFYA
jgi:hypothetical protein